MSVRRSLLALSVVLAACTATPSADPSPSPSPAVSASPVPEEPVGVRVAVVLPPQGERPLTTAGTRLAAEAVARHHEGTLGEYRTLAADADGFAGDIAVLLAERGYDLVCLVGDGVAQPVLEAARQFPATRFCAVGTAATPPVEEIPDNVLVVRLRMEEAAYLAGVAAAAVPAATEEPASEDDPAPPPPPAGFVAGSPSELTSRQRVAFGAGLSVALGTRVSPRVDVEAATEEELLATVTGQFDAGVPVVFLAGGPGDAAVLEAAEARGSVIVHRDRDRFDSGTPPSVLVWFLLDAGVALDLAVAGMVGDWRSGVRSVGLAEDAIRPQAGAAEGATSVFGRLREAADGLRDGTTTVPGP